MHGLNNRIT